MKIYPASALLITIFLFSGCTSLKDFQKMDANSRADFICSRDREFKRYRHLEADYQSKIDDVLQSLERGYRVHSSCHTVFIDQPEVKCTTVEQNSIKTTHCEQISRTISKEVCSEHPVAIDTDLEQENLERYRAELEASRIHKNSAYYNCYSKVQPMSAEEAFMVYDQQ